MFGLGFTEIVVILVVALLVLGPRNLPDAARKLGKIMRDLRGAAADFQTTIDEEMKPESGFDPRPPHRPADDKNSKPNDPAG